MLKRKSMCEQTIIFLRSVDILYVIMYKHNTQRNMKTAF